MTPRPASTPPEILFVEDNPGDIELVREALTGVAVHVSVVMDGEHALALLLGKGGERLGPRPDLVLLDLNLPVTEGKEILREIRRLECTVPVVVFTGSDAEEDVEEAYRLGANCYVVKPPDFEQYLSCVRRIVAFWIEIARFPARTSGA